MPGRNPKPAALRKLEGNPGKRPLPAQVGTEIVRPPPPRRLHGAKVRAVWREVVDPLADANLLTALDLPMLEILVSNLAAYRQAADEVNRNGLITWEETNASKKAREKDQSLEPILYPLQNPNLAIMLKLAGASQKILTEFGMSPSSRTKVSPIDAGEGETEFERLAREARERRAKRST